MKFNLAIPFLLCIPAMIGANSLRALQEAVGADADAPEHRILSSSSSKSSKSGSRRVLQEDQAGEAEDLEHRILSSSSSKSSKSGRRRVLQEHQAGDDKVHYA